MVEIPDGVDEFQISDDGGETWRTASKAEYVNHERRAGFRNTLGQPDEPGTAGFYSGRLAGRMYPLTKSRDEDEQAELAAMANADKAADPNWEN